jgi:hypothetical protein
MNDTKTSEGQERAKQQQEILKKLLSDDLRMRLMTPSVSNLRYNHEDPNSPKNNPRRKISTGLKSLDEDDEIHDDIVNAPTVSIFASTTKNSMRLESISRCEGGEDDDSRRPRIYRVPSMASKGNGSKSNRKSPSRSQSQSRSKSCSGRKSKRKETR